MRRLASLAAVLLVVGIAGAEQIEFVHLNVIDLSPQFNSTSGYGDNPLSIAFDGTNAYLGGYNATVATGGTVGVVKVENVLGVPTLSPLASTVFVSPQLRGLDALAYAPGAGGLVMSHDSGSAGTSFVSRRNADGSEVWTVTNPQASRPMAMAVDPRGDAGGEGVAFLVQGSGRRRLLAMADGATVFDGSNGGIINTSPSTNTTWRALAFDGAGNIALTNEQAFAYGVRSADNQWQTLDGAPNLTSRSVLKDAFVNNVGQGIAILEDMGSDLLAMSGRNMTTFTDLAGGVTNVDDTRVHIRNLDGSTTGLSQIVLNGDEDGLGAPWQNDTKNLVFGRDAAGAPVLLVVDFVERRLDVYGIPEPASLGLVALGLLVLRRR